LSDTQIGEDQETIDAIVEVFNSNKTLIKYQFLYNGFTNDAAQRFLDEIKEKNNKWIFKLILDQGIDKNIIKEINAITKKNKPKKGKKKKKKKKD